METEQTEQKKSKIGKKLLIPLMAILLIGCVIAVGTYFHQTNVDIVATEGRSSADIPFTLGCNSGETVSKDIVIHNSANVILKARLTWTESTNPNAVTYNTNMPIVVELTPLADTTQSVSITCDTTTPEGTVTGLINYEKTA